MNTAKDTTPIWTLLCSWYTQQNKGYPWRQEGVTAYSILVSEFMLQQTQAARVAQLLPHFLISFPSLLHLANATNAQVVQAWRGLGYNSRALRLRDTARILRDRHQGVVPDDPAVLRLMPGIGSYASASLPCFIYGKRTVVVDVNVRRVYSRWMRKQEHTDSLESDKSVRLFAEQIIPHVNADVWHHAVMDLGSTVCKARQALCSECPMVTHCPSAYLPQAPFKPKQKTEPMLRGRPRRLWRGELIQKLRLAEDGGLCLTELLPDSKAANEELHQWLEVLQGLQADELIDIAERITLRN